MGQNLIGILMKTLFSALCLLTASPAFTAPLDMFRDCDECPEMIELPLGEFMMGAPEGEAQLEYHWYNGALRPTTIENPFIAHEEGPLHLVKVDIPVAMARTEITYDQWMICVNDSGCNGYTPNSSVLLLTATESIEDVVRVEAVGSHPVRNISYIDALAYVDWLNDKTDTTSYRLPTEAEWEYAARAGTQTPFYQGVYVTQDQVNYSDQDAARVRADGDPDYIISSFPVPVENLDAANGWGLRHMSGNVGEITLSCWSERQQLFTLTSQYLEHAQTNGTCDRVRRGGNYVFSKNFSRTGARYPIDDDARVSFVGFRVLREMRTPNP
ncbi:hypothetical protein DS901_14255 [Loktanella sp. D2R18]|nr:hypothetical protein DS901_14255 [Loktanella sp. D2R18]